MRSDRLTLLLCVAVATVAIAGVAAQSIYPTLAAPQCSGTSVLADSVVAQGFCPRVWASGLALPRALAVVENGDVLALEQGYGRVSVLWDADGDGESSSSERAVLCEAPGLNHAVRVSNGYLYASNATNVFRWPYTAGDRSALGAYEMVVYDIPCCHHTTRSLEFDSQGRLYVQVGSGANVDPDSTHARIQRFEVADLPQEGLNWNIGELFADGLRNEVGIRFDAYGQLWGVENGVDDLYRADLGGDIHNSNPCEELNLFGVEGGAFFGYPYCWSSYNLTGYAPGTQFYQPEFVGTVSDAWCQDTANVVAPSLCMQAHAAPMDILFWNNTKWSGVGQGDAFVAFHGSWNANPPRGYRVDLVTFDNSTGMPLHHEPFLGYQGPGAYEDGKWLRPVGLASNSCAGELCLLVSSDATGEIIAITQ